jgi:hypothetical protein
MRMRGRVLESIETCDVERIVKTLVGVANGLDVGNDSALIRETANRSGFSCESVQLVIGLCAIFWGRAELEGFEFHFKNELIVRQVGGASTYVVDLASWEPYLAVASLFSLVKIDWLTHFTRTYSTEYAEVLISMPCLGIPAISRPMITIVPII